MTTAAHSSVSIFFVRAIIKHARQQEINWQRLLQQSGINPDVLTDNSATVSLQQFSQLETATILAMDDEALGYTRSKVPFGCWRMMCLSTINAATLEDVLNRLCSYYRLHDIGIKLQLEKGEDVSRFLLAPLADSEPAFTPDTFLYLLSLYKTYRYCTWIIRADLPLISIKLPFPAPANGIEVRRLFYSYPMAFEQDIACFEFQSKLLTKPVARDIDELEDFLQHPIYDLLSFSGLDLSWSLKVRQLLKERGALNLDYEAVATDLGLQPKTLSRHLKQEGTTYKEIKNHLQQDAAVLFLSDRQLPIEEVAYRVGFSEPSAFTRAFKSWMGLTPAAYRKSFSPPRPHDTSLIPHD